MGDAKAIGGYFERDIGNGNTPLPNGTLFNSGRSALRYIVRQLGIKSIHVPYYTCPVVWHALEAEGCKLEFYEIGLDFKPKKFFAKQDFVLYTNYFGCCGGIVDELVDDYPNLIVDCAQAYYAKPKGRASFSSPRKFFGLPDGGVAYGVDLAPNDDMYPLDDSRWRMIHLDLRSRGEIAKGYREYQKAEAFLDTAKIMRMSPETRKMLCHVEKERYREIRLRNFERLDAMLHTKCHIHRSIDDVAMVYPYITDDSTLRTRLIQQKIFVATYWPGLFGCNDLQERIVPLPIDQRYDENDMKRIVEVMTR